MSNPLKKTMVYLGLADEEETYAEEPQQQSRKSVERDKGDKTAPVTPLHCPAVVRQPHTGTVSEILTVHPSSTATLRSSPRASGTAFP